MCKRKIGKQKPCRYRWRYLCYFTLHMLENLIRDIVEGNFCYFSQPNFLLLGTNKLELPLGLAAA